MNLNALTVRWEIPCDLENRIQPSRLVRLAMTKKQLEIVMRSLKKEDKAEFLSLVQWSDWMNQVVKAIKKSIKDQQAIQRKLLLATITIPRRKRALKN